MSTTIKQFRGNNRALIKRFVNTIDRSIAQAIRQPSNIIIYTQGSVALSIDSLRALLVVQRDKTQTIH